MKYNVLFVIPSMTQANGIPAVIVNYLNNIDLSKFNISILSSNIRPSKTYLKFFEEKNIKVYFLNDLREEGILKYYESLNNFFKENHEFDLVYSNVINQSLFIFKQARKYGIKKFAVHSHSTVSSSNFTKKIVNDIMTYLVLGSTHNYFACSEAAGKSVFKQNEFIVINNAIEYKKYAFSTKQRNIVRERYRISDDERLIGFVGRFAKQKNIYFFIELMKKLEKQYKIMMIGTGALKNDFIDKCKKENIINRFIFIDESPDVYNYYSAFDFFILPSHFEGLPVSAIEAQASGVLCMLSDTISDETKILDSTCYFDRNNIQLWEEYIETHNPNVNRNELKLDNKFNIEIQAEKFEKILIELCK